MAEVEAKFVEVAGNAPGWADALKVLLVEVHLMRSMMKAAVGAPLAEGM